MLMVGGSYIEKALTSSSFISGAGRHGKEPGRGSADRSGDGGGGLEAEGRTETSRHTAADPATDVRETAVMRYAVPTTSPPLSPHPHTHKQKTGVSTSSPQEVAN